VTYRRANFLYLLISLSKNKMPYFTSRNNRIGQLYGETARAIPRARCFYPKHPTLDFDAKGCAFLREAFHEYSESDRSADGRTGAGKNECPTIAGVPTAAFFLLTSPILVLPPKYNRRFQRVANRCSSQPGQISQITP
jgi:hypothetical protein